MLSSANRDRNSSEIPDNGIDDDANGYVDDVHGWNFLSNDNQSDDRVGHGTHVAGTIAAQDNNSLGIVGVAPDAQIMPVRVFAFHTETTVFMLSQGILYAAQNGADVINNSWEACGSDCSSVGVVEDAVRTAHAAGAVVVFAAGNQTKDIRNLSPQNQPESIVVSATTLHVWDRRGNPLPGWPRSNPTEPSLYNMAWTAPIVVDLDGDNRSEIITSRAQEYWSDELQQRYGHPLQAFRYDGTPVSDMARPAYGAWHSPDASAGVADIDGDGRLELVWAEIRDQGLSVEMPWPRLFSWDLTTQTSNAQSWPMYRADARRSGVAQTVVPIVRLNVRNQPQRVNGLARFLVRSGGSGVIQFKHPWRAVVRYAVGGDPSIGGES